MQTQTWEYGTEIEARVMEVNAIVVVLGVNPSTDRQEAFLLAGISVPEGLAPGQPVTIVYAGTEFSEAPRAVALRGRVDKWNGRFRDLPAGSFRESGTNVNTTLLVVERPWSGA